MAKKTILYEVIVKNGHGTSTEFHVGQTKELLKKSIETKDVKVDSIKSLGQKTVDVQPDSDWDIEFNVKLNECEGYTFDKSSRGYHFLRDNFQPQVDNLEKEIDDAREE